MSVAVIAGLQPLSRCPIPIWLITDKQFFPPQKTQLAMQERWIEERKGKAWRGRLGGFEDRRVNWFGPEVAQGGGATCCSQLPIRAHSHHSFYPTVSTNTFTPTTHPNAHTHTPTFVSYTNPIKYKYMTQICLRALRHMYTYLPSF